MLSGLHQPVISMAFFPEYENHDGIALAALLAKGEISTADLLRAAQERMDLHNPAVNAVLLRLDEQAARQPQRAAASPLAGLPILIKDLQADIQGCPTHSGSHLFQHHVATEDSELIRRYRQAGLIFAGKTTTPEFGLYPYTESRLSGATRNPWDTSRTCGGSSGGSAAAVATGMVPIAHGGDGGGSIRIPASNCGLFGLKPSRGRSPCGPHTSELWQGYASEHALTRSVRDSAAMLDILCKGFDTGDAYHCPAPEASFLASLQQPVGQLRIAFTRQPFLGGKLHADGEAALSHSLRLLRDLGHEVEEAHPPLGSADEMCHAMLVMICGELACLMRNSQRLCGRKADFRLVEADSWTLARYGELLSAGEFAWMRDFALRQGRIMQAFHQRYDVLVTPVLNQPPAAIGALATSRFEQSLSTLLLGHLGWDWTLKLSRLVPEHSRKLMEYIGWTIPFNMSGQPAMSVPLFWNDANLPIGTQMVAGYGKEALLLQLAAQLEQAQPWFQRRPPLHQG